MSEALATHHKIKAEWTKASKNEILVNSSSESDKLEIVETFESEICETIEQPQKIKILEQIVIYPIPKSVKCHFCDKNFDKSVLEDHQKIHEKTFFNCSECDKKFKRKSSLRKHFNYLHRGRFKYECKECKVTFIDLTKYELHTNTKHKTKEAQKKYQCQDVGCGKSFASPEYLKRHQVTHNDEFKYKCATCDQKFKWMTSLQIHQTIHSQNKTLVECSICFKRFFNHRTLERHQKIHKNVKYKCMLCDKVVSNRKDNIRRHIRHLHAEVQRSEISSKIVAVENNEIDQLDEDQTPTDDLEDETEMTENCSIEVNPRTPSPSSPPPMINNRVKVIQSIGNPNKHHETASQPDTVKVNDPPSPSLPQKLQEKEIELKLPPKKKAIALSLPSTSSVLTAKPKYDPIEHYRKILLGFSKDVEHPTSNEENIEEEEIDRETQVFPVHWRKRTSQNFLFRR